MSNGRSPPPRVLFPGPGPNFIAPRLGTYASHATCAHHFVPDPLRVAERLRHVLHSVGAEPMVEKLKEAGFGEALAQRVVLEYTSVRGKDFGY